MVGMKMEISTVMSTIKVKLKDEIWKMCQVREEIKGQLSLPKEVEDWELVVAVEMSDTAGNYANVEDMIEELVVEATVHALEKGWQNMSQQPNRSKVLTAAEYRVLRDCAMSALEEEAMDTDIENSMWMMMTREERLRKPVRVDDDSRFCIGNLIQNSRQRTMGSRNETDNA